MSFFYGYVRNAGAACAQLITIGQIAKFERMHVHYHYAITDINQGPGARVAGAGVRQGSRATYLLSQLAEFHSL